MLLLRGGKFGNGTSGFKEGAATTSAAAVSGFKCHLPPSTSQGLEKGQEKPRPGRKGLCLELGRRRDVKGSLCFPAELQGWDNGMSFSHGRHRSVPCLGPLHPQDEDPGSLSGGCCDSELLCAMVCASCPLLAAPKASASLQGRAFSASIPSLSIPIPQAVGPACPQTFSVPVLPSLVLERGCPREWTQQCCSASRWDAGRSWNLSSSSSSPTSELLLLQGCGWDQRNSGFLGAVMLIGTTHCPSPPFIPMALVPRSPQPDQKSLSKI